MSVNPLPLAATRILRGIALGDLYFSFDLDDHRRTVVVRVIRPADLADSAFGEDIYEAVRAELGEQIIAGTALRSKVANIDIGVDRRHRDADRVMELALCALRMMREHERGKNSYSTRFTDLIGAVERHRAKRSKTP